MHVDFEFIGFILFQMKTIVSSFVVVATAVVIIVTPPSVVGININFKDLCNILKHCTTPNTIKECQVYAPRKQTSKIM
jgi:hypothetical protein